MDADRWLLCDALMARREAACARRVANLTSGPESAGLQRFFSKDRESEGVRGARVLLARARAALREGRPGEALDALEKTALTEPTPVGVALEEVAFAAHAELGAAPLALGALERAADLAAALDWKAKRIECLCHAGGVTLEALLDAKGAEASFARAMELAGEEGQEGWRALAASGRGVVAGLRGDLPRAIRFLDEAARLFETVRRTPEAARAWADLAVAYQRMGRYAAALRAIDRAWALAEAIPASAERPDVPILVLTWRAGLRVELGDSGRAVKDMTEALRRLEAAEAAGLGPEVASVAGDVHGQRAYVLLQDGRPQDALAASERALRHFRDAEDPRGLALAIGNDALILRALGDTARGFDRQSEAWQAALAQGDLAPALAVQTEFADTLRSAGLPRGAQVLHLDALAHAESLGARALLAMQWAGLVRCHAAIGEDLRAVFAARQLADGVGGVVGGLGDEESAQARQGFAGALHAGALAAVRLGDVASAQYLCEAGRAGALLEALGGRDRLTALTLSPESRAGLRSAAEAEQRAQHAFLDATRGEDRALRLARAAELRLAQEAYAAAVGRVQRDAKARAGLAYPTIDGLAELQSHLAEDDLLVLFSLPEQGSDAPAFAVRIERVRAGLVDLGPAERLRFAARTLREESAETWDKTPVHEAHELLVKPLKIGASVRRVLISPDDELAWVPWVRLLAKDGEITLEDPIDGPEVFLIPSGTVLGELRRQRDRDASLARVEEVLALADPDYTTGLGGVPREQLPRERQRSDLPRTRVEALAVTPKPLLGRHATEAGFRARLEAVPPEARLRAVLLAGHGLIDEQTPLRSAIALTPDGDDDGDLTALEIAQLSVRADLVVLSACESGRGGHAQGEGMLGLVRAFMFAGAPRVLATLWKVEDQATEVLVTRFFERLKAGDPPAVALRDAQEKVRATKPAWRDPYYWAAWVLWGLP